MPQLKPFRQLSRRQQDRRLKAISDRLKLHSALSSNNYVLLRSVPNLQEKVWIPEQSASKAIINEISPEISSETIKIEYCLGPYETYDEAEEANIGAQYLSSNETGMVNPEHNLPTKRVKTARKYLSLEDAAIVKVTNNRKDKVEIPMPPLIEYKKSDSKNISKIQNESERSRTVAIPVESGIPQNLTITKDYVAVPWTMLEKMNQTLENLEKINQELVRKVDLIFHHIQNNTADKKIVQPDLQGLPEFPLDSCKDFIDFCTKLTNNQQIHQEFSTKIRRIGGKTWRNHLTNILVTTITNNLGKQLTWEGQRQTNGIKNTSFSDAIIGVIVNQYKEASKNDINKAFSSWLRLAGTRLSYHEKKQQKET